MPTINIAYNLDSNKSVAKGSRVPAVRRFAFLPQIGPKFNSSRVSTTNTSIVLGISRIAQDPVPK